MASNQSNDSEQAGHDAHGAAHKSRLMTLTIAAIGIVYGDIGTSPLYTMKEVFSHEHGIALTHTNILGVVSLILWGLILIISLKYVTLVLRANNRGEGGIMALTALAMSSVTTGSRWHYPVMLMGMMGAGLFYGDGVITPAISVLSAIEGLEVATPAMKPYVLPITVTVLVALYIGAIAWGTCHLFSGRAAFLITGATMATIIAANVFFIIIPNQRKMVASMKAGEPVNPILSKRSKHRSMHNSYVTLPVIFGMISNQYSLTYSAPHNWLVLIAIMAAGALIRHFFIQRHKDRGNVAYPAAAVAILAGVIWWLAPAPPVAGAANTAAATVDIAQVQKIVEARCVQCHAAQPSLMPTPAKGVMLDSPDLIRSHAQAIYQQVVVTKAMPLGNMTKITDEERALIAKWFEAGAK